MTGSSHPNPPPDQQQLSSIGVKGNPEYRKPKRVDIQCHRGVAIAGVLLFHLQPHTFPNGFLGVDMFFVISGYLIAQILTRESSEMKGSGTVWLWDFYQRRIKRILPAYFLTLIWVPLLGELAMMGIDSAFLRRDTKWALVFGTNLQNMIDTGSGTYAQMVSRIKSI